MFINSIPWENRSKYKVKCLKTDIKWHQLNFDLIFCTDDIKLNILKWSSKIGVSRSMSEGAQLQHTGRAPQSKFAKAAANGLIFNVPTWDSQGSHIPCVSFTFGEFPLPIFSPCSFPRSCVLPPAATPSCPSWKKIRKRVLWACRPFHQWSQSSPSCAVCTQVSVKFLKSNSS